MASIDLRDRFGRIRDQGARPTCLVFAASAAHEAHLVYGGFLSVEYLFFHGAQRSHKSPKRGLSTVALAAALEHDGQPDEAAWPYLAKAPKKAEWLVPVTSAGTVRRAKVEFLKRSVNDIRAALADGTPTMLTLGISLAFYCPDREGRVFDVPGEPETAKHAVVVVGAGHDDRGTYLLVRNSWGEAWGKAGHAWLHDDYLRPRILCSAIVR